MRYFFYGSLMAPDVLSVVLGRTVAPEELQPATLGGFRRVRVADETFPCLVADESSEVSGVVFESESETEQQRISFFEGFDYAFTKGLARLESGEAVEVVFCGTRTGVEDSEIAWDYGAWVRTGKAGFLEIVRAFMQCFGRMSSADADLVWDAKVNEIAARESRPLEALRVVMAKLRDPEGGCPWDIEQTFATVAPYTIEEAYEVSDAIAREDTDSICEELGDLLLQVVFHARIAEESGLFSFDDVARRITEKMIARHPHVFGSEQQRSLELHGERWEAQKHEERESKARASRRAASVLDDVPLALPALMRAEKLWKRANRSRFSAVAEQHLSDLPDSLDLRPALAALGSLPPDKQQQHLGRLLLQVVQAAQQHGLDPESALRERLAEFEQQFRKLENRTSD